MYNVGDIRQMMNMIVTKTGLFSLVWSLFCASSLASPPESLQQVNLLYRHGDRSPVFVYPTDINQQAVAWPDGLGWLTNIGKLQHYKLGQYLRSRYDGFLNTSHYNHQEISVQSSGVERCLMSAYCNLAGLFPPQGDQLWNENIPWQPIPVQTKPIAEDNKLAEGASCPRYNQLYQEVLNSSAVKKEEQDNKDFYRMVEEKTGVKQESISDIWQIIDTLVCEQAHNLTWNDWVTPDVWKKLESLKPLGFDIQYATPEMIKLKGGPLLKEIIGNMEASNLSDTTKPKFYMYSAHDTTVSSLLGAMKVFDSQQPIYRALVIVELHSVNNDTDVRVFYKNDTDREAYELTVPGCGSPCTLEKFREVTAENIPSNWTEECIAKNIHSSFNTLTPDLCLVLCFVLVYRSVSCFMFCSGLQICALFYVLFWFTDLCLVLF
ncbi:unnamed protein product [Candidula unifasciata]|uniref:acid phosphatase n=1 Tax=Candidula unifasciata TaxID=100452 RepID=A0A8S4A7N6_9EUPU|nr:unnamed protein product [Candidula unifasciata]